MTNEAPESPVGDVLDELAARIEALTLPFRDHGLDEQAALALGWQERLVTSLGINGRTPGRYRWFRPYPEPTPNKGLSLPNMTSPRKRKETVAALRARTQEPRNG